MNHAGEQLKTVRWRLKGCPKTVGGLNSQGDRLGCRIGLQVLVAAFLLLGGCSPIRSVNTDPRLSGELAGTYLSQVFSGRSSLFAVEPTNDKPWRPDLAVLPFAAIDRGRVTIHNVRNCRYRTEDDYDTRHYDLEFAIDEVQRIDFLIVPFKGNRLLAHTMLSFGLRDGRHFVISVEARLKQGETYTTVAGPRKKFELMYLIADERDIIPLRTEIRQVEVYLYKGRTTPEKVQELLIDMLERTNQLARQPEFYDVLKNNCTTNLVDHINHLRPGTVPRDWRVLLPGHSDALAYELGLLDIPGDFESAKAASKINGQVQLYRNDPNFSQRIRDR
jgi:hypothetical protein